MLQNIAKHTRVISIAVAGIAAASFLTACGTQQTPVEAVTIVVTETATDPITEAARETPAGTSETTETPAAVQVTGPISREQAISIAIEAAGGSGQAVDVDRYDAGGAGRWEILVRADNGNQTEVYVNATTGEILKVEDANDW